jgi:CBS domain-containing protein
MPYCPKCGTSVDADELYCHSCGARLGKTVTEEFSVAADDLIKKVEELIHEGNVTRIIVKDEKDKVLLELPVTVAVVGTLLLPWLAALGVVAGIVTRCKLVVVRRE